MIKDVKSELASFERNIRKAPSEVRSRYKLCARKQKTKLRALEKLFETGNWKFETE